MDAQDPDFPIQEALAYALWKSVWRTRLKGLDECRLAAAEQIKHMKRCGVEFKQGDNETPAGLGHLCVGFDDGGAGEKP